MYESLDEHEAVESVTSGSPLPLTGTDVASISWALGRFDSASMLLSCVGMASVVVSGRNSTGWSRLQGKQFVRRPRWLCGWLLIGDTRNRLRLISDMSS